jgi:hypothetical protein
VFQVPFKTSLDELYQLIWQEGVELAVSIIPQAEMGESFYLPLTRSLVVLSPSFYHFPARVPGCILGSSDFDKIFENCFASCGFGLAKDI